MQSFSDRQSLVGQFCELPSFANCEALLDRHPVLDGDLCRAGRRRRRKFGAIDQPDQTGIHNTVGTEVKVKEKNQRKSRWLILFGAIYDVPWPGSAKCESFNPEGLGSSSDFIEP
jgi:hypothetical protein